LANREMIVANREFRLCRSRENPGIYILTGKKPGTGGVVAPRFIPEPSTFPLLGLATAAENYGGST
jgi:hypothetical protein